VTWQTKTNFHFGVFGKFPAAPLVVVFALSEQAVSSAVAASEVLARPAPVSRRRRETAGRSRVSTASSTAGWIFVMVWPLHWTEQTARPGTKDC
jgi:hypothetical protein